MAWTSLPWSHLMTEVATAFLAELQALRTIDGKDPRLVGALCLKNSRRYIVRLFRSKGNLGTLQGARHENWL